MFLPRQTNAVTQVAQVMAYALSPRSSRGVIRRNAITNWIQARVELRPKSSAHCHRAVSLIKLNALRCQTIYIRSRYILAAIATNRIVVNVVRQDEYDVRLLRKRQTRQQQNNREGQFDRSHDRASSIINPTDQLINEFRFDS